MLMAFKGRDGKDIWVNSLHVLTVKPTVTTRGVAEGTEIKATNSDIILVKDDTAEVVDAMNMGMRTSNGGDRDR